MQGQNKDFVLQNRAALLTQDLLYCSQDHTTDEFGCLQPINNAEA